MDHEEGVIISAAEDFSVKIWSSEFDLWGTINQKNEEIDTNWYFPDSMFIEKRSEYLISMSDILKKVKKEDMKELEK